MANSGPAELAAVVAGLGISLMPGFLAGPSLARGELIRLLADWEVPVVGLYVVRPPPAEPVPNKVSALSDIMFKKFGHDDWDGCPPPRR